MGYLLYWFEDLNNINTTLRTAINKAKSLEALNKINLNFGG